MKAETTGFITFAKTQIYSEEKVDLP